MSELAHPVNDENQEVIIFTDAAAAKVKELIDEEENPHLNLRIYIMGGGCSGFQYGFKFDETINPDDYVVEKFVSNEEDDEGGEGGSVKLLCDPLSFQYLKNAEIDYKEDVNGSQFVIRNPGAKTTCGCGSSFSV
jgi:iron-sulfur cluster insertion protein